MKWKMEQIGMNPSVEKYLVLHRFGTHQLKGAVGRDVAKACPKG
jgi:hypothetical protein